MSKPLATNGAIYLVIGLVWLAACAATIRGLQSDGDHLYRDIMEDCRLARGTPQWSAPQWHSSCTLYERRDAGRWVPR